MLHFCQKDPKVQGGLCLENWSCTLLVWAEQPFELGVTRGELLSSQTILLLFVDLTVFCVVYLLLSYIWSVAPFLLGWYIQRCCSSYGKFCWWNSSTRFWVGVPEHRRWFGNRLPPHRCSLAYTYGSHQHCKINIFNMILIHMFAGSYAFLKRAAFLLQCGKLAYVVMLWFIMLILIILL